MIQHRTLQPEMLDSLPTLNPAALQSRRDLRVINALQGNFGWFASRILRHLRSGDRILEIGAGTGELSKCLSSHGLAVDGLDLWPCPADWPSDRAWHQDDIRTFDGYQQYDLVIAN